MTNSREPALMRAVQYDSYGPPAVLRTRTAPVPAPQPGHILVRVAATSVNATDITIGLGLLFDTLIVRSFMTPAIAALLGRWFWWPQKVRSRPASHMLQPYGSRPAVRELLDR